MRNRVSNIFNNFSVYYERFDEIFERVMGFKCKEVSLENIINYFYKPTDPSSLGVSRMLFGLLMLIDGAEERGGAELDLRWGDPNTCHFPLLPIPIVPLPYMAIIYAIMWIGALGVALGYKFKKSILLFTIPYWYILLSDKSYWNNHSYLFGLLGILFSGTQAHHYLSLDAHYDKSNNEKPVPYWNYFIMKYQLFILYFVAGLKKSDVEWLSGYAMSSLSKHWVFDPFKIFLSTDHIDYLIVHWFAFVFDLTICFWMMYGRTRPVAMLFCASFHLMNSRLFLIGMFPWVCLATMPLFCPPDWPKIVIKIANETYRKSVSILNKSETKHESKAGIMEENAEISDSIEDNLTTCANKNTSDVVEEDASPREYEKSLNTNDRDNDDATSNKNITKHETEIFSSKQLNTKASWKKSLVVCLLLTHMGIQAFLPYSHFITKGFNNWTNGLYGYSWDMMVHSWDTILVLVKVVDKDKKIEMFIDPEAWVPNDRWSKHGDMMYQYARCLQRTLAKNLDNKITAMPNTPTYKINQFYDDEEKVSYYEDEEQEQRNEIRSKNISIFIDVWCSLNGRFQQRMFNPNIDLLNVTWSPFRQVEWLMPLLSDLSGWRRKMADIQSHIYSWNNYSDVLFVADFPGLYLENYITTDTSNVSLTVLEGQVFYESNISKKKKSVGRVPGKCRATHLTKGESILVKTGVFHKIHTVGSSPACYMYSFMKTTTKHMEEDKRKINHKEDHLHNKTAKLPLKKEFAAKLGNIALFLQHVGNAILNIVYGVPMVLRIPS